MLADPFSDKLDCHARVVTPENIAFEYALAGPFQRLPAFILDILIRTVVFGAFFILVSMSMAAAALGPALGPLMAFLMLVGYFLTSWFYGIFFEAYYNGRTPGKMLMKLRVIGVDGRPINGVQAALRNLLRLADMNVMLSIQILDESFPPVYVIPTMTVGLVAMLCTSRMQRIGDLAAGTMVVSEKRRVSPLNLPPDDVRAFGLAELIPPSFEISNSFAQTIGLYMENRKRLSSERREEIARKVATVLIPKFEMLPDTSADLLMCALYVRLYLTEEQRAQGVNTMRLRYRNTTTVPKASATTGLTEQGVSGYPVTIPVGAETGSEESISPG